jgi:hypothetical protein
MTVAARKLKIRASKVRPVLIRDMIVSPVSQRPFIPAHGDALAKALDLNMIGLPVINHRDGKHFICDGQHRVYALRQNGFNGSDDLIDCEVYENLSDEEMAQLFLGRDRRKAIAPFVKFLIGCTAGYPRENAIRRVVEANGAKISRQRADNCISAVASLIKIFDSSPDRDVAVGWVVRVLRKAFQGDPAALDGAMLEAVGLIRNRYNGKAVESVLIETLNRQAGVRAVLRKAEALREKSGNLKIQCIAAVIVDAYNKARSVRERLAPWWKQQPTPAPDTPTLRRNRAVGGDPGSHAVHAQA